MCSMDLTEARHPRGAALLVAVETIFLITALAALLVASVSTENTATDVLTLDTQAMYLAESGAEYAIQRLCSAVASKPNSPGFNFTLNPDGSALEGTLTGYDPIAGNAHPLKPTIQWRVFQIEAGSRQVVPSESTVTINADYSTLVSHSYRLYGVTARGYMPMLPNADPTGLQAERYSEIFINKTVELDMIPLFQYLALYSNTDLEMLPGANAVLKGRIHSNRDLYVGAQSTNTLTFNSSVVWASGAIRRHRKDGTADPATSYYMTGTTRFRKADASSDTTIAPVNDTYYPIMQARGALQTPTGVTVPTSPNSRGYAPSGYDSEFAGYDGSTPANGSTHEAATDLEPFSSGSKTRWNGTVQANTQQVPTLAVPADIQAYRPPNAGETANYKFDTPTQQWVSASGSDATSVKGEWQQAADLVIVGTPTGNKIYDRNGLDITNLLVDGTSGTTPKPAINPLSTVTTMYDSRESQEYDANPSLAGIQTTAKRNTVTVTEIDMVKLNKARRKDTNADIFPASGAGLTVYAYRTYTDKYNTAVADKALQGIRVANGATLNNNMTLVTEDPVYVKGDLNTGGGVPANKKTAVLMADATNVLSNQWNDSKTASNGLPTPTAPVTVNAALIGGINDTTTANYNGGLENYARFHENWSGIAVNITGCFCSIFSTRYAKSVWPGTGSPWYNPPNRNFSFDSDLLKMSKQPPNIPYSVSASRVVWWRGRDVTWWP